MSSSTSQKGWLLFSLDTDSENSEKYQRSGPNRGLHSLSNAEQGKEKQMPVADKATSSAPCRVDIPGMASTLDLSTVGGRIAWARIRKKLRQQDVATKLGKSRATIVQYEKNNINPPNYVIGNLATTLSVTPEFLAFGRQGVDARRNGKVGGVVSIREMSVGGHRGLYQTGEFILPTKMFEGMELDLARTRLFVLEQDEPEFEYFSGDRLLIDNSVKDITDPAHSKFLVTVKDSKTPIVVQRESLTQTGKVSLTDGKGVTHRYEIEDISVFGAVTKALALV
jgi:transcriptional regulator with XRE-family HTH domain